jgi:nicotinate-nucleotide--dimethylbenzimidazole phosphoribosyltransferase
LTDEGVCSKAAAVQQALEANAALLAQPGGNDPSAVLRAVGGLEVAAMVGAYLEAAVGGLPVIVDGFVSGAAALLALTMDRSIERVLFWSHHSDEKGTAILLEAVSALTGVKAQPALSMGLRLGEGTGAVLALPLLRSACAIMTMATLQDALSSPPQPRLQSQPQSAPPSGGMKASPQAATGPHRKKRKKNRGRATPPSTAPPPEASSKQQTK